MAKRKTIGENPLDAVVPPVPKRKEEKPEPQETQEKRAKERFTVHLPVDLIERARNTVYWTPGLTLASLTEEALDKLINEIEKEHGKPFPPRRENLKPGRPVR